MSTSTFVVIELVLVFGGLIAFAAWEIFSTRRAAARRREREAAQRSTSAKAAAKDKTGRL